MSSNDLLTVLKEMGAEANFVAEKSLNSGGCCVYAAAVARELDKRGIPVKVIVAGYHGENPSLDEARKNITVHKVNEWGRNGVTFCHVGVLFSYNGRWYTYDSEKLKVGRRRIGSYGGPLYAGSLTIEEAEKLAEDTAWNSQFNRDTIPAVHRVINRFMERVQLAS